jgi:hypothetical protein
MDAFGTDFDGEHSSGDTPGFADVLAGLVNRDAVGGAGGRRGEEEDQRRALNRNPGED